MFAKLSALVGAGSSFPYNVGESYGTAWGSWTHHEGTVKEDGSAVSIFKVTGQSAGDSSLASAKHGVKRLRTLRHPNVVAFKNTLEIEEKGSFTIYLITEPVKPLQMVLDELDLSGEHRNEYLAMGLNHISSAISFLNNDCKMIHGVVCMSSVMVTDTLDWKLHSFDLLSEHASVPYSPLRDYAYTVGEQYKSSEFAKGEWDIIPQQPPWGVDAWGLGCLMQEVFSGVRIASVDQLREINHIPEALRKDYQRLLGSQATKRLNPAKVAKSKFLNNQLVDVVTFMETLAVKDSVEKESFFRKLPGILPALPGPVAERKLLPMLSSALEFGGAPAVALSCILQIGNRMDEAGFSERVIPCISKLFASPDRSIRRSLLENIDKFGNFMTEKLVESDVYPHLQNGFTDNNAYIRELTLKSMRSLAHKLSQRTLNQSLLKFLAKLQVDQEPTIRTNTTILLGSISELLGEAACKRVLLNAFSRALRDEFPPAKVAGLRALMVTKRYYSAEESAQRVIPQVAPLAVDAVEETRETALQCLRTFTESLAEHSKKMKEAAVQQQDGVTQGPPTQGTDTASASGATSYLSWAVSSFGLKSKTGGEEAPTASGQSISSTGFGSTTTGVYSHPRPEPVTPPVVPETAPVDHDSFESAGDGWDQDDDDDVFEDFEEDQEELAARNRLSRVGGAGRTARQSASGTTSTEVDHSRKASKSSDGWGDDLDDVWKDMGMKADAPKATVGQSRTGNKLGARKVGGAAKKPMKLGAQKLVKKDF